MPPSFRGAGSRPRAARRCRPCRAPRRSARTARARPRDGRARTCSRSARRCRSSRSRPKWRPRRRPWRWRGPGPRPKGRRRRAPAESGVPVSSRDSKPSEKKSDVLASADRVEHPPDAGQRGRPASSARPRSSSSLDFRRSACRSRRLSRNACSAALDAEARGPGLGRAGEENANTSGSGLGRVSDGAPSVSTAAASWRRSRVKLTRSLQPVSTESVPDRGQVGVLHRARHEVARAVAGPDEARRARVGEVEDQQPEPPRGRRDRLDRRLRRRQRAGRERSMTSSAEIACFFPSSKSSKSPAVSPGDRPAVFADDGDRNLDDGRARGLPHARSDGGAWAAAGRRARTRARPRGTGSRQRARPESDAFGPPDLRTMCRARRPRSAAGGRAPRGAGRAAPRGGRNRRRGPTSRSNV